VAGLQSAGDADGWRGVGDAMRNRPCTHARLIVPSRPSEYRRALQTAAEAQEGLVIAASFLLTDAVVDAARGNPGTRFVLVDPLVATPDLPNLAVLSFREDQAAYLAGALAGLLTRSGVVAGVYGPDGAMDRAHRVGFEHGASYARPGVRVLGAYQPASEGAPYANPEWGATQARKLINQGADVIYGAGGTTGRGALVATTQAGVPCIGAEAGDASGCLVTSTVKFIDRGVRATIDDAAAGPWSGGQHAFGLAEMAVGLAPLRRPVGEDAVRRLQTITELLASGNLTTGT
jgi:basic membrane protein A and related proteins